MTDKIENTPLYNSRITKNYVEYIRKHHPEIEIGPLLNDAGITSYQLEDGAHWFTQEQVDRFQESLKKKIPEGNINREVGRQFTGAKIVDVISKYALGFVTPASAYAMLPKLQSLVTRACTIEAKSIGSGTVEVIVKPQPGVREKPYQCENRIGTYESIERLFTNKFANVEHPTCIHRGGDVCRYIISWENTPTFKWKRIRKYSFLAGIGLCSVLYFFLPGRLFLTAALSCATLVTALSFYSKHVEVKGLEANLKNQGEAAKDLIEETNIRYSNAMLVQEIGQAISVNMDVSDFLEFVMKSMKKRLEFDRGIVMLANREKSRLVYAAGYGSNPGDEQYMTGLEFHLDNPASRGPLVEAYKRQAPVLVDNVTVIEKDLSKRSRNFAERIGAHSFICIPIVFEGDSMGVLAVDNIHSRRPLSQTDVNLLMGIVPQIAISLNNVKSYRMIQEREEKFRSLSENAPDIIYTTDAHGLLTYVNPAWEKALGYRTDEVIGRSFTDFVRKEDTKNYIQLLKQLMDHEEQVRDYRGILLHKDGSERFFSMSGTRSLDPEGKLYGLIGVLKDITDRKQLEAQLLQAQKMEAVGTLAGGIAHDFNNLLMGIQGFTSLMLLNIKENHVYHEKLKGIEDLARSGADLTRQLLGFARVGKYETKTTDLNEVIEKTANMFGRAQKDIHIHKKYQKDLWATEVDRGQIEQVLLNVYVNAWQAMPGGGDIYLETSNVLIKEDYAKSYAAVPGFYIRVSVKDTGVGMDERTRERVFEPFFTTKEMGRGTGLGLASAYGIIKGHNGIIHVESELGQGTTFYIYLPASEKKVAPEKQVADDIKIGEGTILLAEDEEMVADVCREILESLGYKVHVAHNGGEAIEIYRENRRQIDLVILDIIMPGLGVDETFDALKALNPGVRVMLSSGYSNNDQVRALMERGCFGFIQKPYRISDLSKMVSDCLRRNDHLKNRS